MKFLVVFALFAVAFADIEPVRLREAPVPAIEESNDHRYSVKVVQSPTPSDAQESPASVINANSVNVIDFVEDELKPIAPFQDAELSYDTTVKFVDEAVNVDNERFPVKVVESPLEEAALLDERFLVKVVESAIEDAAALDEADNFIDEDANDLVDDENDEQSFLVKAGPGPVNIVDGVVNEVVSPVAIALSFDSNAEISKLIESTQKEYVEGSSTVISMSPEVYDPTTVKVIENAVNVGHILPAVEDLYEDTVDAKAKAFDDFLTNVAKVTKFPRLKFFDNPMLR